MRRNVARIGLVAALALSMGVATATAPPTRADDHTGLIAPARASAGLMNYAINLSGHSSSEDLARATSLVASAGGVALASYPELGTFFAQSESASFAPDLAVAMAKAGISVHSVGPTRVAAVPEGERVPVTGDAPAAQLAPRSGDRSPAQSGAQSGGPSSLRGVSVNEADKPEEVVNWGAQAMSAADAAAVPIAHAPVTVGVIDTGIDDTHPDLVGRVDTSRSVSCGRNGIASQAYGAWRDDYFHGTHVAGIIAANHNDIGIDGIAPDTTLVSIKASNEDQLMYPEYVTCGFMWAASHGVDIVNNSYSMDPWVYWSSSDPEQAAGLEAATRAIAYAQGRGLAVMASAGNDGMDNDNVTTDSGSPTDLDTPVKDRPASGGVKVPAMVEGVSQVSAATRTNPETKPEWANLKRADFSNYGTSIDFTAPGQDIYSTVPTSLYASGYAKTSGTSMATPHITGIAALIKATHPGFRGKQITDLMRKQAAMEYTRLEAPDDGKEYRGYGFINALTTMRRDQMQPTVQTLQYRVGKGEWKDVDGATLPAGPVTFYAEAIAPISHLHMDVAGLASVDRDGSGKYGDDPLGVSIENLDLGTLLPEGADSVTARVQVSATGINLDRQADDDTGREAVFTVSRDPNAAVPPAPAPDADATPAPSGPAKAGITAPARSNDQLPANYAVNLPRGTDHATFQRALAQASNLHGLVLAQYPAFGTFFVQAASPTFSPDLGAALVKEGISYDSIGPTRQAPVGGNEVMVPVDYETRLAADAAIAAAPRSDGAQGERDADLTPDPQTNNGWHLQALHALEAQDVDVMRAPVTVGVMDQSIDDTVPDLAGQVDHSKSVSCSVNGVPNRDPAAWRWDDATHGTHVAGSIAAKHDGVGVDGVNPTLRIAAINVASRNGGYFYPEYIACGFVWAADHGISVTNGSYFVNPWKYWMPNDPEQAAGLEAVQRAADYAASKDVINVVAAGNWTTDLDNPPATDDSSPGDTWGAYQRDVTGGVYMPSMLRSTLAVSALALPEGEDPATGMLEPTSWSNWGATSIDFAAPGAKIYAPLTSWYGKAYGNLYGTSQASPLAAAVIATLRQVHPEMNAEQIIALAKQQASDLSNWGRLKPVEGREYRGAGLPNALDAVLKDQAKPEIGAVEYSTDGTTWRPLAGETLAGRVFIRVTVTGPVTSARLLVGDREVATGTGSGAFEGNLVTLQADGVDVSHLKGAGRYAGAATLTVEAMGRNNDARADDDATLQVPFTVSSDQVGPEDARSGRWVSGAFGWWWRYENGTYPTSTQLRIDGAIYRFDVRGYMVTGWVSEGGRWYYYGPSGGQASGWVSVRGSWYYLDPISGEMASGWTKVRDTWYYLGSSGAMRTGWLREGSTWYHLSDSGSMDTGWVRLGSSWYHFAPSGAMNSGWLKDGDSWFYLSTSGEMTTGERWIDGTRYVFDEQGRLLQ
ncbi:S8 family serine peptidase [Schaalia odontolytica]|uniref:Subtilisin Savinase n=1 Tax=Schaalia odontolytica TaxID=1660 RepID=A0A2X0TXR2_9ACTO|nr:S8 family serine peptidase [Schaalia odontolytica]WMS27776.1 S8 family serine peptidase [Schaalia odontolytica]SPT54683.1 Subtilisin Savinase [Schaalia odontolytica]